MESQTSQSIHHFGFFYNNDLSILPLNFKLPPEVESKNIEYKVTQSMDLYLISFIGKFKLINTIDERISELATQMNWRLAQTGEAFYEIGY